MHCLEVFDAYGRVEAFNKKMASTVGETTCYSRPPKIFGSEGITFRKALIHPSEYLQFWLPTHWISFPMQPNSSTPISSG